MGYLSEAHQIWTIIVYSDSISLPPLPSLTPIPHGSSIAINIMILCHIQAYACNIILILYIGAKIHYVPAAIS